jgi:hypothetical protein
MTSADDKARAVLRAYADNIQPPPVTEIIARAEGTREDSHQFSTSRPRARGRFVLAAASVVAAVAVAAVAANQLPGSDTTVVAQPSPSIAVNTSTGEIRMAPGCPPPDPVLAEGSAKSVGARAGQQLTLPIQVPAAAPDRPVLNFTIYLAPSGALTAGLDKAVAQSSLQRLTADQRRASVDVQIPAGLAPGTYDIWGVTTYRGPSVCGFPTRPTRQRPATAGESSDR